MVEIIVAFVLNLFLAETKNQECALKLKALKS